MSSLCITEAVLFCDWKAWLHLAGLHYVKPHSRLQQQQSSSVKNLEAQSRPATDIVTVSVICALKTAVHDCAQSSLPGWGSHSPWSHSQNFHWSWIGPCRWEAFVSKCWKSEASLLQSRTVYSCFLSFLNGPELLPNSIHWKHQEEEKKKQNQKCETTAILKNLFIECQTESSYWPRGIMVYSGCQVITEVTLDHHLHSQYSHEWQCQLKQGQMRESPQFIISLRSIAQGVSKWGFSGLVAARFHWKLPPAVLSGS